LSQPANDNAAANTYGQGKRENIFFPISSDSIPVPSINNPLNNIHKPFVE